MLKRLVNEARIDLAITTLGPLLIRSGQESVQGETDMEPVLTRRKGELAAFIPGSSLKGVFRSHSERILRTLNPVAACNPFTKDDRDNPHEVFCGERFKRYPNARRGVPMSIAYRDACPACRLFGCTEFIGRFAVDDGYADERPLLEQRDGVGINRVTGGSARGALFKYDVVAPGAELKTSIWLRNFELWQLGLVLASVEDLRSGLLRLGMASTRGMGRVTASVAALRLSCFGQQPTGVPGLGSGLGDGSYGTDPDDHLDLTLVGQPQQHGLRWQWQVRVEALQDLADACLTRLMSFAERWQLPEPPQATREGAHRV